VLCLVHYHANVILVLWNFRLYHRFLRQPARHSCLIHNGMHERRSIHKSPKLTLLQVVLAAAICTRGGKPVISRQFREMQRSRIEGLLASFPKLAASGSQHTTVEQDNVRYVYQPLDELYMVLITNRQSNILQDIDSLHLFAQVVSTICKSLDEREIVRHAFELLSAFDEIVTLGYRDNLTLSQIKTFLDMESHEERIQEIISRVRRFDLNYSRGTNVMCCRTKS
jgi:hypothetical protein